MPRPLLFAAVLLLCNVQVSLGDDVKPDGRLFRDPVAIIASQKLNPSQCMTQVDVIDHLLRYNEVIEVPFAIWPEDFGDGISGAVFFLRNSNPRIVEPVYMGEFKTKERFQSWLQRFRSSRSGVTREWLDERTALVTETKVNSGPIPAGEDPDEFAARYRGRHNHWNYRAELDDSKAIITVTRTRRNYFRMDGLVVFHGYSDEILEANLPSAESLAAIADRELEAKFDFSGAGGAIVQEAVDLFDEFAAAWMIYLKVRGKAPSGRVLAWDLGSLPQSFRSLMDDLESAELVFRTEDSLDTQVQAKVVAESSLQNHLKQMSDAKSRMSALVDTESAATFHACFRNNALITESVLPLIPNGLVGVVRDDYLTSAVVDLIASGMRRPDATVELLLKLSHSDATDGVVFGGVQLADNPLAGLARQFSDTSDRKTVPKDVSSWTEHEGFRLLCVQLSDQTNLYWETVTSLRVSHAFLAYEDGVLWFAVGGPGAKGAIVDSIATCRSRSETVDTPTLTFDLNVDQMLSYPRADPIGVGALALWMDRSIDVVENSRFKPAGKLPDDKTLLLETIRVTGAITAHCDITASAQEIKVNVNLGAAFANYILAEHIRAYRRAGEARFAD